MRLLYHCEICGATLDGIPAIYCCAYCFRQLHAEELMELHVRNNDRITKARDSEAGPPMLTKEELA